jgi:hypothetical protein
MISKITASRFFILLSFFCWHSSLQADGTVIDKIYDPYVTPLETEIEWRAISQHDDDKQYNELQLHRFGIGQSVSENVFIELYLIGEKKSDQEFTIAAYELEAKVQLTEQGEYSADWGLLFELEKEREENIWEIKTGLLSSRQWGRWVGTANLFAIYEWGDDIEDELEAQLSLQLRYRYSRRFEPAIEFYTGQNSHGVGPVITGIEKFGGAKKLHWELGLIFGINDSPDQTWRALLEFEF